MGNKYPMHSPSPTYSPSPSPKRESTCKQDPFDYPPSPSPPFGPTPSVSPSVDPQPYISVSPSISPLVGPRTYMSYEQYSNTNQGRYKPYTSTVLPDASYTSYANINEGIDEHSDKIYTMVKTTVFIVLLALIITIGIVVAQGEQAEEKVEPVKIENTHSSAFDNKKSMFDN